MKVSAEDLRLHYAELSDEGLLDIRRCDLAETARLCYDEELLRRGIRASASPALPPDVPGRSGPPEDTRGFVPVASYRLDGSADLARQWLVSAGFRTRLNAAGTTVLVQEHARKEACILLEKQIDEMLRPAGIPTGAAYIRHGMGTVRPRLFGPPELLDFVERTFDATELERFAFGLSSFRVEAAIGDSVIVLEIGDPPAAHAAPVSVSIYVPDIDDTFARALAAGAHEVSPPTRQPNDERSAAVKDVFGNIWYIATYVAPTYPAIDWDE